MGQFMYLADVTAECPAFEAGVGRMHMGAVHSVLVSHPLPHNLFTFMETVLKRYLARKDSGTPRYPLLPFKLLLPKKLMRESQKNSRERLR